MIRASGCLIAMAWGCLLVAGCNRTAPPSTPSVGLPSSQDWTVGKDPVPGIGRGWVFRIGNTFAIWSDSIGSCSASKSSSEPGRKCQGTLTGPDGRSVKFHGEIKGVKAGQVTIDGVSYNLADGNLFLVSLEGGQTRVQQVTRDDILGQQPPEAFARNDPDIVEFFSKTEKAN